MVTEDSATDGDHDRDALRLRPQGNVVFHRLLVLSLLRHCTGRHE